jgi:hypothetical protein
MRTDFDPDLCGTKGRGNSSWGRAMTTDVVGRKTRKATTKACARLKPGNVVGDCKLLRLLGAGGMGEVWLAYDRSRRTYVALKLIRSDLACEHGAKLRFDREFHVARQLTHPNLVAVLAAGLHRGRPYLVMEYVEGTDLHALVEQRGPLPEAVACEYVRQAALGLHVAHEKGFVHRDVKPDNLLLALPDDIIKVADWGIAKASDQLGQLTQSGAVMGSPGFMAPEQVYGAGKVDRRADVYSLGCVLYYGLTGLVPQRHQRVQWRSVGLPESLSEPVRAALLRMTEHDQRRRFSSAGAAAAALGRVSRPPAPAPDATRQTPAPTQRRLIGSLVTTACGGVSRGVTGTRQFGQRIYAMASSDKWREGAAGWLRGARDWLGRLGWVRLGAGALAVVLVVGLALAWAFRASAQPAAEGPALVAPAAAPATQAPPVGQINVSIETAPTGKKVYVFKMSALGVGKDRIDVVTEPDESLERMVLKVTIKPAEKAVGKAVITEIPASEGIERRWPLPHLVGRTKPPYQLEEGFIVVRFAVPETTHLELSDSRSR